jgi:hypothetical protein
METWFDDVMFEHEQCGGGYATRWRIVYVDSDGVEYAVKFIGDAAHEARVTEITDAFFNKK